MTESDLRSSHDRRSRHLAVATAIALAAVLAARMLGPTDLWHQTQPRTISYTVDMLVHGGSSWLLPVDFGGVPATKPPLVNWLATPFVAALGRASELGHKMPSVLALAAMAAILARIGARLGSGTGWLAALMCLSAYPFFKLGYLARPDMVLTAILLGAWWSATRLLLDDPPRRRTWQAVFWTCVVAVALDKGPVAVLPILYVPVVARLVCGRWSAALRIGPLWALPALAVIAGYYAALWRLDPQHVYEVLWKREVLGRVTGDSPEVRPMRIWKD
ncbi:MAG: glycosyltransferase family 39 protein, partial [Phycisphaerales bacterium]|nr:glycosyltransferase family 39 protein [Phycisphaerales bacterium]